MGFKSNSGNHTMVTLEKEIEHKTQKAVAVANRFCTVVRVYLFGSQVNGSADQWSDIDLAVFAEGVESWGLEKHVNAAAQIQKEVGDDVEVHFFPANALTNHDPASFAGWIITHGVEVDTASIEMQ